MTNLQLYRFQIPVLNIVHFLFQLMYKEIIDINNIESSRQYQMQSKSMSESTKIAFASQFLCSYISQKRTTTISVVEIGKIEDLS